MAQQGRLPTRLVQIRRDGLKRVFELMIMCLFMLQNSAKYQAGRLGCHLGSWMEYMHGSIFGLYRRRLRLGNTTNPGSAGQRSCVE
jgi:hypothetical protein